MGFTHVRVLDPAAGIGHFFGLMPEATSARSRLTAIELDPPTASIARRLYRDADIRTQGFEAAALVNGSFDLAVSNVPFGDYKAFDPQLNDHNFLIHDYFFAKGIEKVRPGGLMVFITSKGTLDKVNSSLRDDLYDKADFLGAIRLPNTAFKENANTEVTTDIVFLRRMADGEKPSGPPWLKLVEHTNGDGVGFQINEYFAANPHMMLGTMAKAGTMYRVDEPALVPDDRELGAALREAVAKLPQGIYRHQEQADTSRPVTDETPSHSTRAGSGNPLVIEKATIDAEVMRLTRLKKQHAESQYQMRYRIKSLGESAQIAERHIAGIREDLRTRTSTRGDDFTMTVLKETFTDRTKAGRALVFFAAAMKPFTASKQIGSIAGFPITLQRLEARTSAAIHGKHTYDANVSDNALGTISSIEHALGSRDERLKEREADLTLYHRQSEDLAKQLNHPFEHDEKLSAATKRQQEIVTALDITKNQASAKVDEGAEQNAEVVQEKPETPGQKRNGAVGAVPP